MILGIGTDICDIRRIAQTLEKHDEKFKARTFTEREQAYCDSKSRPDMSYAKRFAAKEAVAKALATDTSGALGWLDVEVVNKPSGRPTIEITGTAAIRLQAITPDGMSAHIHISLSDDDPYATAFAVVEALPS